MNETQTFEAVLLRITFPVNAIWANLGMPADSGEPSAMINLTTSFVYMLLMSGRSGMKPVPATVQTVPQI